MLSAIVLTVIVWFSNGTVATKTVVAPSMEVCQKAVVELKEDIMKDTTVDGVLALCGIGKTEKIVRS